MSGEARESAAQPRKARRVAGEAEPQQRPVAIETAHPDVLASKALMQGSRRRMANQTEERGAADDPALALDQAAVHGIGFGVQVFPHHLRPTVVAKGRFADGERGPRDRPGPQGGAEAPGDGRGGDEEAQPHAGQAVEFTEGAQDHHRIPGAEADGGPLRRDVYEGLVDDQPAAPFGRLGGAIGQSIKRQQAPVRVVWVDDDQVGGIPPFLERRNPFDAAISTAESAGMLIIGWSENRSAAGRRKARHPLDKGLRAGRGDDFRLLRHAVASPRRVEQGLEVSACWKAPPKLRRQFRHGIGMRVDAGREVEPIAASAPETGHRLRQVTAMQHAACLPPKHPARQWLMVLAAMIMTCGPAAAQEAPPARVISLNMCTDQLLLDLAEPRQIAGLSPFAADAARSFLATQAQALPILSGSAEEVMVLRPDLVVSGTFTKRATREFIRARGVTLEEFAPVRTIAETKRQITRFGEITGAGAKAAARNAEIDAALAELRVAAATSRLRVLPLARRGWVSGANSLMSDLLAEAGLVNAAGELGIRTGGRTTLEQIVHLRPDAIVISHDEDRAEDQGLALLLHPSIQTLFPRERRILLPERLTICGGAMLAEAMRMLASQLSQLKPRDAAAR